MSHAIKILYFILNTFNDICNFYFTIAASFSHFFSFPKVDFTASKSSQKCFDTLQTCLSFFKAKFLFPTPKVSKACPKVKAILRTRGFYHTGALIGQFKAHVLPHIEGSMGAIFHASTTHLSRVDSIQKSFLKELGVEVLGHRMTMAKGLAALRAAADDDNDEDSDGSYHC